MAENIPNIPSGAVPPKPAEAAKVQPKKETVRINLPPKPTAAPTIKIPAPAVSAPPTATAPAVSSAAAPVHAAAPAPPAPRPAPTSAPASRPAAVPRPVALPAPAISALDKGLAIAAALIGVLVLVRVLLL